MFATSNSPFFSDSRVTMYRLLLLLIFIIFAIYWDSLPYSYQYWVKEYPVLRILSKRGLLNLGRIIS